MVLEQLHKGFGVFISGRRGGDAVTWGPEIGWNCHNVQVTLEDLMLRLSASRLLLMLSEYTSKCVEAPLPLYFGAVLL